MRMTTTLLSAFALLAFFAGCSTGKKNPNATVTGSKISTKEEALALWPSVRASTLPEGRAPASKEEEVDQLWREFQRDSMDIGEAGVEELRKILKKQPDNVLILMFRYDYAGLSEYFLVRDGNKAIEEELRLRGDNVRTLLEAHKEDKFGIFDGGGGPGENVGMICHRLLRKLGKARSEGAGAGDSMKAYFDKARKETGSTELLPGK
ncbi:MAG: hypothetical protein L6R28_10810 [Planctomycetes bacterium]|nr:hypothetical protein [Planctomycetota bacterium]